MGCCSCCLDKLWQVFKCCGCINLRTGSWLIAFFSMLFLLNNAMFYFKDRIPNDLLVTTMLILSLIFLVFNILLMFGLCTRCPNFLAAWIIAAMIFCLLMLLLKIVLFFLLLKEYRGSTGIVFGNIVESWKLLLIDLIFYILGIFLLLYFIHVVNSYRERIDIPVTTCCSTCC